MIRTGSEHAGPGGRPRAQTTEMATSPTIDPEGAMSGVQSSCQTPSRPPFTAAPASAARVASAAGAGEVLVSRTVVDLVAGSGVEFDTRGEHALKGVPGEWRLFALRG